MYGSATDKFINRIAESPQKEFQNELAVRQDARAQRQQDLAIVSSSAKEHQLILQQLSLSNPKAVDGYIQNLRSSNKALAESMDRLGISDMKAVISTSGSVGMEMPVPMSDEIRQKIKAVSGVDVPEGVTQAIIKSDGRGNINYSAASAGMGGGIESLKFTRDLRKDFVGEKQIQITDVMSGAVARMSSVWDNYKKNPNIESKNALDQAIIITFNKMLDPGSVVRESEYERTPQGAAAYNRVKGYTQKITEGGVGLTDIEREDIVETSKLLLQGQKGMLGKKIQQYVDEANLIGVDPQRIVGEYFQQQSTSSANKKDIRQDKSGISWEIVYKDGKQIGKRRVSPGGEVNYGSSEIGKTMKQVMTPNG